jgi:hypothetical protein
MHSVQVASQHRLHARGGWRVLGIEPGRLASQPCPAEATLVYLPSQGPRIYNQLMPARARQYVIVADTCVGIGNRCLCMCLSLQWRASISDELVMLAERRWSTRLETRTKESNTCASVRVANLGAEWKQRAALSGRLRWEGVRVRACSRTTGRPGFSWRVWARAYLLGPERLWTMGDQDEARGNSGGGPKWYWRANRSSELPIGAKD